MTLEEQDPQKEEQEETSSVVKEEEEEGGRDMSQEQQVATTTTTTTTGDDAVVVVGSGSSSSMMSNGLSPPPSRVVHIRNIPSDASDSDLLNLGLPFGRISNMLLLRAKNQAMIEFADISSAQAMVQYWSGGAAATGNNNNNNNNGLSQPAATVRGKTVFCQFSVSIYIYMINTSQLPTTYQIFE